MADAQQFGNDLPLSVPRSLGPMIESLEKKILVFCLHRYEVGVSSLTSERVYKIKTHSGLFPLCDGELLRCEAPSDAWFLYPSACRWPV